MLDASLHWLNLVSTVPTPVDMRFTLSVLSAFSAGTGSHLCERDDVNVEGAVVVEGAGAGYHCFAASEP